MRAVVQRVKSAKVDIAKVDVANETTGERELIGEIGRGFMILLGVEQGDTDDDLRYLVEKVIGLRVFEDEQGKMNLSIQEVGGEFLVVSQFTLLGDCRKGRRPSFIDAAPPEIGNAYYEKFVEALRAQNFRVATGRFRADMDVSLVNTGPVTILLDSRKKF